MDWATVTCLVGGTGGRVQTASLPTTEVASHPTSRLSRAGAKSYVIIVPFYLGIVWKKSQTRRLYLTITNRPAYHPGQWDVPADDRVGRPRGAFPTWPPPRGGYRTVSAPLGACFLISWPLDEEPHSRKPLRLRQGLTFAEGLRPLTSHRDNPGDHFDVDHILDYVTNQPRLHRCHNHRIPCLSLDREYENGPRCKPIHRQWQQVQRPSLSSQFLPSEPRILYRAKASLQDWRYEDLHVKGREPRLYSQRVCHDE